MDVQASWFSYSILAFYSFIRKLTTSIKPPDDAKWSGVFPNASLTFI